MTTLFAPEKSIQGLWNDYLFLTQEMGKFLDKQDMDLFYELMDQRERLQNIIEKVGDESFCLSTPGQQLLQSIQRINENIRLKLQYILNNSRNQNNISNAYGGLGVGFVGNRMDRQT